MADRYNLELQALAASLAAPAGDDGPALLTLDPKAAELLRICCANWLERRLHRGKPST